MIHKAISEQRKSFALYLQIYHAGIVDTFYLILERLQWICQYIYQLTRIS